MTIKSLTDIGIRRKENQDNYWSARMTVDGEEAAVICLCDGMGGLADGGQSSGLVVEKVRDFFKSGNINFDDLRGILNKVNSDIFSKYEESLKINPEQKKSGTTCTIVYCCGGNYKILHVGDSRCYLIRNNKAEQITTDHSALHKYGITKQNNPDLYKKYKNLLTRCIGVKPNVLLDYFEGVYQVGDKFLVCCDGLWHYFEDYSLNSKELNNLRNLFNNCMENGETDNITAAIIEL